MASTPQAFNRAILIMVTGEYLPNLISSDYRIVIREIDQRAGMHGEREAIGFFLKRNKSEHPGKEAWRPVPEFRQRI